MCQSTIALYCFLDDLLKAMNHQEDERCQVGDAQVLTTALTAMLDYGGNYQKALLKIGDQHIFSRSLSRSRFSRRLTRLTDLVYLLFHQLGKTVKDLNYESRYRLDSFPVAVCDNIRIKRNRLTKATFDKQEYRGVMTSKRRYFFGVRVQLMTTVEDVPVEFAVLPGSCSDLQGLAELAFDLSAEAEVAADAAYTAYEWEDHLWKTDQIRLLVNRKKNSKRGDSLAMKFYKFWLRHPIETTIGEVEKMFPKKIHATTLSGFILKVALFLWAFQLDKAFIQ